MRKRMQKERAEAERKREYLRRLYREEFDVQKKVLR